MHPGVSHLLKLCVLSEFYARFLQDAQVNETLLILSLDPFSGENVPMCIYVHASRIRVRDAV